MLKQKLSFLARIEIRYNPYYINEIVDYLDIIQEAFVHCAQPLEY